MIHRFVDLPSVSNGIFVYSREYFGAASYRQVYYIPYAGGNAVQVTTPTGDGDFDTDPDVSPDFSQIVFLRRTAFGSYTLYVVNADGTGATQIDSTANCTAPMWSPAGDKILYAIAGNAITIDPDGTNKTTLAPTGFTGAIRRPTWNRDGTKIAFQVERASGTDVEQLWVMDADGSNATKLDDMLNTGLGGLGFSWQHSADVVTYTRGITDNHIYTINGDGTGKTTIATGTPSSPVLTRYAWSSDDTLVYAIKDSSAPWAWYKVPASGSGASILNASVVPEPSVGFGQAYAAGGRVYIVNNSGNLVSVAEDGTDLRAEDGDGVTTYEPVIQGNTTGL